ncbi:uncharacterized protein LOC144324194 isoform X3 [Canis aureus]
MTICLLVKDIWMAYHSIYHIGPVICPTGIPKSRLAGYLWDPIHCLRGHDIKNLWVSGVQQFYAVYILLSTPHESPHLFLMTTDEKYVVFWNGEEHKSFQNMSLFYSSSYLHPKTLTHTWSSIKIGEREQKWMNRFRILPLGKVWLARPCP